MKKRTAVILALAVLLVLPLWSCKESYSGEAGGEETSSSKEGKIQELEKQCVALTKSNTERRVYEALYGLNVKKKTYISIVENNRGAEYVNHITLFGNGDHISITSKKMRDIEEYRKYKNILDDVIYSNQEKEGFEKNIYGICAYRNEENKYIGNIETLILVQGG